MVQRRGQAQFFLGAEQAIPVFEGKMLPLMLCRCKVYVELMNANIPAFSAMAAPSSNPTLK